MERFNGRTIQLTHDEIETIKTALQYVYDRKLEIVSQNKITLGTETSVSILEAGRKFLNTQDVFDGERDV